MTDYTIADWHRPSDHFRDYLDHEIGRAFRRDRAMRHMRMAAIILVSITIGSTASLASAQMREGSQRDSLLEAARAEAALVTLRLDLARAQLAEQRRYVAAGAMLAASAAPSQIQVSDLEAQLGRAGLNIEEIRATAKAPRDELNAPLVNGRDFVKQRLQVQAMNAQQRIQAAELSQAEAVRRVRVGVGLPISIQEADLAVMQARRELIVLAKQLELRKEFLEKGTPIAQLIQRLDQAALRQDVAIAQSAMALASSRAAFLDSRRKAGAAGELEVLKVQVELKERQIELASLARRLNEMAKPEE